MSQQQQSLQELQHIKQMMERSSRFISLSGLSGVMAGLCALVGAYFAYGIIHGHSGPVVAGISNSDADLVTVGRILESSLFRIALLTFISAFLLAFLFTYLRSKKNGLPVWGNSSRRLLVAVAIPMAAGAFFLLKLIQDGNYSLIAPGSLIFYGLGLINASKYTLGEVKWLGLSLVVLGIINCWMTGYGLYFWAIGFGLLHILYGLVMWYKYERG